MGIQEIRTFKVIDDFDGTELEVSEPPEPIELVYGGQGYKLYMSEANAKKLDGYLQKIIKNADTFSPGRSAGSSTIGAKSDAQKKVEAAGDSFKDVKAWAIAKGSYKTAKGEPISDTAPRLSEQVWQDYATEHKL